MSAWPGNPICPGCTALTAEIERLNGRIAELHKTLVRLTKETPYPEEITELHSQQRALIAKVGTLRAQILALLLERK